MTSPTFTGAVDVDVSSLGPPPGYSIVSSDTQSTVSGKDRVTVAPTRSSGLQPAALIYAPSLETAFHVPDASISADQPLVIIPPEKSWNRLYPYLAEAVPSVFICIVPFCEPLSFHRSP